MGPASWPAWRCTTPRQTAGESWQHDHRQGLYWGLCHRQAKLSLDDERRWLDEGKLRGIELMGLDFRSSLSVL